VNTHQKLTAARERLAGIESEIAALSAKRRARLVAGDSVVQIAAGIDKEVEALEKTVRLEAERIELLEAEVKKQEIAAVIKRKAAQIERMEKKLDGTVELARELEASIAKSISLFHEIVRIRGELLPQFALGDPEVSLAVDNYQGAALSAGSITALLKFELFRQGARVWSYATPLVIPEPSWPAPACPRLDLQGTPEKITPFVTAIGEASRYAISLMKDGRAPGLLSETPGDARSPAQVRLGELLKRQLELASDPAREVEYMALVREIEPLQTQVELEREATAGA
jgi:hypothetical protein